VASQGGKGSGPAMADPATGCVGRRCRLTDSRQLENSRSFREDA
jgi:hypothetical protein